LSRQLPYWQLFLERLPKMGVRMQFVRWLTVWLGVLATPALAAAAENADRCADAYELTQSEQRAGRLFDARKNARICAAKCPHSLAGDCSAWEKRISAQIPSFVVHARGADGVPLAVEVEVDGSLVAPTESGSIEAEPGLHRLLLRHAGRTAEAHVELAAGVRDQLVEVTIADSPPLAPAAPAPVPSPRPPDQRSSASTWRWLVGGLGVATLAAGGAIAISGEVLAGQLRVSCKPHCTQAQANEVVQRWVIGDTMMGIGGAVVLGAILWPSPSSPQSPRDRRVAISVSAGLGRVQFQVAF
jgi:hypothetical protein